MTCSALSFPCLWCGAVDYYPSLEHIVPEALGCPDGFILTDGVCASCNNGLGHVDQALVRQFEVVTVMTGIPRKKGKRPTIEGWAPIHGSIGPEGPEIHLNAGPGDVTIGRKVLKPVGGSTGVHSVNVTRHGSEATLSFGIDIGRDPKLRRALYKIGLETIAYFNGMPRALHTDLDPVRAYVRQGIGDFAALVMDAEDGAGHRISLPYAGPDGLIVPVTLFGITFLLDLLPGQSGLDRLEAELRRSHGDTGWSRLGPTGRAPLSPALAPTRRTQQVPQTTTVQPTRRDHPIVDHDAPIATADRSAVEVTARHEPG